MYNYIVHTGIPLVSSPPMTRSTHVVCCGTLVRSEGKSGRAWHNVYRSYDLVEAKTCTFFLFFSFFFSLLYYLPPRARAPHTPPIVFKSQTRAIPLIDFVFVRSKSGPPITAKCVFRFRALQLEADAESVRVRENKHTDAVFLWVCPRPMIIIIIGIN